MELTLACARVCTAGRAHAVGFLLRTHARSGTDESGERPRVCDPILTNTRTRFPAAQDASIPHQGVCSLPV
eukprot:6580387-Prymnesium_polylepis.1